MANADASSSGASSSTQPIALQVLTTLGTTQTNQTGQNSSGPVGIALTTVSSGLPPTPNMGQLTAHIGSLWKRTYVWFKDPKSDTQATTLIITVIVGVLGLLVAIVSVIVPSVQGRQSLVQGGLGLTQAEINNDYVRLTWCQALPQERPQEIKWCAHHLTPDIFDDEMRNDKRRREVVDVSKYSGLLSPGSRAALEKHLMASGFSDGAVTSLAAIESAVEFLHTTRSQRGVVNNSENRSRMIVVVLTLSQWLIHLTGLRVGGGPTRNALWGLTCTCAFAACFSLLGSTLSFSLESVWKWLCLAQPLCLSPLYVGLHDIDGRIRRLTLLSLNLLPYVMIASLQTDKGDVPFTWMRLLVCWLPAVGLIPTKSEMFRSDRLRHTPPRSDRLRYGPSPWRSERVDPAAPHEKRHPFVTLQLADDLKSSHNHQEAIKAYWQARGSLMEAIEQESNPEKRQMLRNEFRVFGSRADRLAFPQEREEEKTRRGRLGLKNRHFARTDTEGLSLDPQTKVE